MEIFLTYGNLWDISRDMYRVMVFKSENITESIPGFIGSMKIAFITSVSGLLGSLILNYCLKDEVKEEMTFRI